MYKIWKYFEKGQVIAKLLEKALKRGFTGPKFQVYVM